ncbi:hypothetical protein NC651_007289 [Populus alba x Populus x berolinensis]|nr:hypothetical protein NC651_007289 [Populus alba x Populus x berolinensis]
MRLQLGEWLNSFLVVVSAGHGLAEMVLLAARSFRGRPVCGSDVASLLLSVEELRKRKGSEVEYGFLLVFCQKHGAKIRGETGWPLVNEELSYKEVGIGEIDG